MEKVDIRIAVSLKNMAARYVIDLEELATITIDVDGLDNIHPVSLGQASSKVEVKDYTPTKLVVDKHIQMAEEMRKLGNHPTFHSKKRKDHIDVPVDLVEKVIAIQRSHIFSRDELCTILSISKSHYNRIMKRHVKHGARSLVIAMTRLSEVAD